MATDITFQPLGSQVSTFRGLERVADVDPRLTRTHYFDGRLLTAEDLNRDQLYLDRRLREVGQTLGQGILRGLDLTFDPLTGLLKLSPGLAVTSAGRVLQLARDLTVDLGDRALLVDLNDGSGQRLDRGLYAVVLRYIEVGTDIAEVFPQDLGGKRGFQFDVISEAVQLGLVPLPQPLGQQNDIQLRANLVRVYLGDPSANGTVPEDAVALGVLAISNDRPQWLDPLLLRQPLRSLPQPGDLQEDLARHYEALLDNVLDYRRSGSLGDDFAASEYFRLLPPAGSLPKASIDPVAGRQGYFPESFKVWIAPVRRSDLELIRLESMVLPPIDLSLNEPADVIVLAPLSNSDYGQFALRLEREFDPETRDLPKLDLLRLRLYPRRPVHELDTDATTWQSIWNIVGTDDVLYIRRPLRTAETGISGIVLAQGTSLPEGSPATDTPADGGSLLHDEDTVFLGRVNFNRLSTRRPPADAEGQAAVTSLTSEFGGDATAVQNALDILLRIPRQYDAVVWQTVLALARGDVLPEFLDRLIQGQNANTPTAQVVSSVGGELGMDEALTTRWTQLDT
jgi:hypothetical protein